MEVFVVQLVIAWRMLLLSVFVFKMGTPLLPSLYFKEELSVPRLLGHGDRAFLWSFGDLLQPLFRLPHALSQPVCGSGFKAVPGISLESCRLVLCMQCPRIQRGDSWSLFVDVTFFVFLIFIKHQL